MNTLKEIDRFLTSKTLAVVGVSSKRRGFGYTVYNDLKGKKRTKNIALPRQIAMYIVKQLTSASLPEIGRQFGGKHHTTVLHSINKIDALRRSDKDLNRTINKLMDSFG